MDPLWLKNLIVQYNLSSMGPGDTEEKVFRALQAAYNRGFQDANDSVQNIPDGPPSVISTCGECLHFGDAGMGCDQVCDDDEPALPCFESEG